MREMSPKQKIFVAAYVAKPNATKAAITAGYSAKTARSQGQRMLTNVDIRKYIDQGLEAKHKEIKLSGIKLIQSIEDLVHMTSNPQLESWNPHAALKAIFYLGREQQMEFATERREVVSHGDIAQDIAEGRERVRRARARAGKKAQN